uniref:Ribosomal protein S13 n=1 Tax=Chlamydomonas leiostraca TaxID=1034604 RepID=A0A7S0X159_9CHLO|mmetsp:Transcript_7532/g.18673  ORF Transcript_7532/g.18673 Transcript_7532/m.18673 type:complete len:123 (+) Transcript_7532:76-444(+)|eukprot:CAMPEP_0202867690 /NCGR_PEP_ID=MMETSP1391-20130828/9573_1 /ASSEMBLY_ACC=CAM_ASM_000867 /TAXON_ID=1034604 /ORGANISM="Chlamydomonas leiostraca, Strain SAG 11-49" /LENGTH=122 /DNA_ID=CAMNT_0049547753 /DNA_START=76 /DNA_END=444 /DNA_ORIENTATION=-
MVQIARTTLNPNKAFYVALQKVFGIGRTNSVEIAEACGISKELKVKDVKEPYIEKVVQYIQDNHLVGDQLKRQIRENILSLIEIKSYRGSRHEGGLSISGGTHSNSRTAKKLRHHVMYDTSK